MAKGDTKTNDYLDIAAHGDRADFPASCCETRSQTLIREVGERIMDLEDEVERLENNPDVADIVATYADLQAYDTSQLTDKDVIRVLQDETHDGDSTYYRYNKQTDTWTYIGESKQYTDFVGTDGTTAGEAGLVPAPATTDAGKFLKADGTWDTAGGGGGVTELTSADYNYPTDNPTRVALWMLEPGVYYSKNDVSIGYTTSVGYPSGGTYIVGNKNSNNYGTVIVFNSSNTVANMYEMNYNTGVANDTKSLISPTIVQTTGTSTTDVMSQNAVTSMIFRDPSTKQNVQIGNSSNASGGNSVGVGSSTNAVARNAIAVGPNSTAAYNESIALGFGATTSAAGEMNIGAGTSGRGYNSSNYRLLTGLYDGQSDHDAINLSQLNGRVKQNAGAPTTATVGAVGQLLEDTTNGKLYICTDATNPYVWVEVGAGGGGGSAIKILSTSDYNYPADNPTSVALWLLDEGFYEIPASGVTVNVSAITTWSPGYGEIVEVTKTQAGTPKSVLYFFGNAGGYAYAVITISSGAEEVAYTRMLNMNDVTQSTGTSTTSVMSQNAVTSMVFADPSTKYRVQIGNNANASSSSAIAIGRSASVSGTQSVGLGYNTEATGDGSLAIGAGTYGAAASGIATIALGNSTYASGRNSIAIGTQQRRSTPNGSVAIGSGAAATSVGEMNIGSDSTSYGYNSSNYRLLTGLYDGQSAHDAATLAQGNTLATSAPTTATVGVLGQLYTDTTNMHTYQCTAIDDTTDPSNPTYTWTQRW